MSDTLVYICIGILAVILLSFIWPGIIGIAIWGVILFCICLPGDSSENSGNGNYSDRRTTSGGNSGTTRIVKGHRGSSYNDGRVTYYPNGNTGFSTGKNTYYSNGVRSIKSGEATYYLDENNRRLGRSVDQGNGVHIYFDDDNNEIGHSYTSGRITDFIGDSFEF